MSAPAASKRRPTNNPDAEYWYREAQRAIAEREAVKRSMESADSPSVYWRSEAKALSHKLDSAMTRINTLGGAELRYRTESIKFSEESDRLRAKQETLKRRMWTVWSALDDGPIKQQLWDIWTEF